MSLTELIRPHRSFKAILLGTVGLALSTGFMLRPDISLEVAWFIVGGLLNVAPLVIPGVLLAGWVMASGAGDQVANRFRQRTGTAIIVASAVGAVLPVCGITVLPLMAGLLAAGVPLAPVMAFWLASPVTDPAMLGATAAMLGWEFAAGKTLSAVFLGISGGMLTAVFERTAWYRKPLRNNLIVGSLGSGCSVGDGSFKSAIWRDQDRRRLFGRQVWSTTRLILIVLAPAFAAEFFLNIWLQPDDVAALVGQESDWAIPLAVIVGGPAYIDGYAALPLTRVLLASGMSEGAALSFLVAGGVVSIWGALAIAPVLRTTPFLIFLAVAVVGSMVCGWTFDLLPFNRS